LPKKAQVDNNKHVDCKCVELVVSDLISGVDAKNVKIVDFLSLENLDASSSASHNQRDKRKQSEDVFSVEPVVIVDCLSNCHLAQTEKHK
jgi:hypothetical protein